MRLSKSHRAITDHYTQLCNSNLYRSGDVVRLGSVIDQIARRMPLQSMPLRVPIENKIGGFELFDSSVNELGPELHGWYGAPGIKLAECEGCTECGAPTNVPSTSGSTTQTGRDCVCKGTTLFLVGRNFSIQETQVIAGGKCVPDVTLISHDIMQVNIPAGAYPVTFCDQLDGQVKQNIDIHVATPYGVTNHLLVPVYEPRDVPCQSVVSEQIAPPKAPTVDPSVIPTPKPDPTTSQTTKVGLPAPVITDAQSIVLPKDLP